MCLILVAWKAHPDFPLVVAANRDEFFIRPTAPAGWWTDPPGIFAGRDLQAGGTWLGVNREGAFAGLTNFRDPERVRPTTSETYRRPAERPAYSVLSHRMWGENGLEPLPDWREALHRAAPSVLGA